MALSPFALCYSVFPYPGFYYFLALNLHTPALRLAYKERIILYGPGPFDNVLEYIRENLPESDVLGYVMDDSYPAEEMSIPFLGVPDDILGIAHSKKASIILMMPDLQLQEGKLPNFWRHAWSKACKWKPAPPLLSA
jgi:hypothetical protein